MKNYLFRIFATQKFKFVFLPFTILLLCNSLNAQLATFPLQDPRAVNGNTPEGAAWAAQTNPNVVTGINTPLPSMYQFPDVDPYNTTGYRVKTRVGSTGVAWPTSINDNFGFDIPIRPQAGFDMNITGITFNVATITLNNGGTFTIVPYFQVDGAGPFVPLAGAVPQTVTAVSTVNFGPLNETFYSGHTYIIRFYVFNSDGSTNGKNDEMRIANLVFNGTLSSPPAVAPTVTTTSATSTGFYTATAVGSFQFGTGYHTVYQAGFVWGTSANPTYPASNSNSLTVNGILNSTITGLTAGTTYHIRSYIITQFGTFYGADLTFTTAPPAIPTLVTDPVTNILSNKATSGGSSIDSSGSLITEKGLVWSTSNNPTISSYPGGGKAIFPTGGSLSFSDWMKQLLPNTTYYVRAYAINAVGVGYGVVRQFTTGAPVATLTAIPGVLDLTGNLLNGNPIVLNYSLTGNLLTPASGNITVTVQAPFLISLTGAPSSFTSSVLVPYVNSQLLSTPIYVELPTNNTYAGISGYITHSGGNVSPANADTVFLNGSVEQSPDNVTNNGNDFWVGFGYQEKMSKDAGDADEARMSIYVTTGSQAANVHVELPSIGYSQTFNIPANSYHEFTNFPTGDPTDAENPGNLPDARLFKTGISNKAVHIYSDNGVPVGAFLHTYTNKNSAAGAMLFPTSTWNSSYTVQAYGGESNNSNPNSFFFVIANEDNTVVTFTPTQPILDASSASLFNENQTSAANTAYAAGGSYSVTLNRGQVFNAMGGFSPSGYGLDLSGSKVSTTCDKKIAVFGGNGRVLVNANVPNCTATQGSDHLIQQMFPNVAWGTKYLTVPTKTMEFNYYRIYVQDPVNTVVKVNGTVLAAATMVNNLYYQYSSASPLLIESNIPVNVSQFITAGGCANNNGSKGNGDPEMIILSPVQQAITGSTVYSAPFRGTGANPVSKAALANGTIGNCASYINVVIPTAGVASFRLDGAAAADTGTTAPTGVCSGDCTAFSASTIMLPMAQAFKPHPQDPTYSMAKFWVSTATPHTLSSSVAFNAIAYGVGNGESYGYNAGTSVNNLSSVKLSVNPNGQDSSSSAVRTCINNPVRLRIALPYNPFLVDSIVWYPETPNLAVVSPNDRNKGAIDIATNKAKYIRSYVIDGRTFYEYESPVTYEFKALGTFRMIANAFGTFASDCPGEDRQKIPVIVGRDNINFTYQALCGNPVVTFTNNTLPMAGSTISSLHWYFGDGRDTTNPVNPITHDYSNTSNQTSYIVKLSTVNSYGCFSSDSLQIDISGGVKPRFTIAPKDTICTGTQLTFDPAQSQVTGTTAGNPVKWTWNFGPGEGADVVINGATSPVQTHVFTSAGLKEVVLKLETSSGCIGIYKDTVIVEATPVAAINTNPIYVCLKDSAAYQDASTIAIGAITSWEWIFDDATTSNLQNPKHLWLTPGNHVVKLVVKSTGGCSSDTATHTINVEQLPDAAFTYALDCTTRTITLTDASNPNGGTIDHWNWTFGDGGTSTIQNPTHVYAISGTDTVTLSVETSHGCKSPEPDTIIVTIAASPVADFTLPGNTCLPAASPVFQNNTTISDGTIGLVTYIWNFDDGSGDLNAPSVIPASPTHLFTTTGSYDVRLTAISNKGCTHSVTKTYSAIYEKPVAVITAPAGVCLGNVTNFSSTSSTAPASSVSGWAWNFGDGTGTSSDQNPTYTYTLSGPKTVSLTVTSAAGCSSGAATTSFSVNLSPVGGFTYDPVRCEDSVITFNDASTPNGAAIVEWKWDFGGDGLLTQTTLAPATHTFANSNSYNVSLVVKDANGCSDGTPFILPVVISPNPAADFTVTDICVGTGLANFTQNVSLASGQIAIWNWDFGVPGSAPGNTATPSFTYTAGGEYNVKITATSDSGCSHSRTKLVKAFTAPAAAFDVDNTKPLCSNLPAGIIDRSAVTGYGAVDKLEIYWDYQNASTVKQTINAPSVNSTYTNQYTEFGTPATKPYRVMVRAFNGPGCSTDFFTDINVLASPKVQFTQPAPICQEANSFTLAGASDIYGLPGTGEYSGDGVSSGEFSPALAGPGSHTITYTYTASNGCVASDSKEITVNPTPVIDFGNQTTINVLEGDVLRLNPTITYGVSYSWTPSTYLNDATSPTPSGIPADSITYILLVKSGNNCSATNSIKVNVVRKYVIPNTFTPNSDGNHDVWDIENLKFYPDVRVRVFSRSGQLVFESYGYDRPWDGKYKGQDCPFGTYYYVIETGGGRGPRTGYVTIIR